MKESDSVSSETGDLVPVVFCDSDEDAHEYLELLEDHGIPAHIGDEDDEHEITADGSAVNTHEVTHGLPILVPEEILDDAREIISRHDTLDKMDFGPDQEGEEEEFDDDTEDLHETDLTDTGENLETDDLISKILDHDHNEAAPQEDEHEHITQEDEEEKHLD